MHLKTSILLLKTSAILWIIWGLVHTFAGAMTIYFISSYDVQAAIQGIADASLIPDLDYPPASGAVIGQHGFNLLWFGVVTTIGAFFIWQKNKTAIWFTALVGGLADLGYFLFLDLGGFVHFVPGTLMTLISASAILLSAIFYFNSKDNT